MNHCNWDRSPRKLEAYATLFPRKLEAYATLFPRKLEAYATFRTVIFAWLVLLTTGAMLADQPLPTSTLQQEKGSVSLDLQSRIQATLENNLKNRSLDKDRNGAWQVIHGSVAYGPSLPLTVEGKEVLAIDYLLNGGEIQGWELSLGPVLPTTKKPGIIARVDAGSFIGQGHPDQWLGYFSQIPLSLDRTVVVNGQSMQVMDWARQSQWDIPNNSFREYSWTLIALTNFFPQDLNWQASDGNTWTLEPLVRFEAEQDLADSPCGGMHRLMGLAHAVRYRQRLKGSMDQGWLMAKTAVDSAIASARKFQNSDGSFSTNYTTRSGNSVDLSAAISATGHTLEFLAYALDEKDLTQPWMEKAVSRLCSMLQAAEQIDLECGGTYHALAGLKLYHRRRFE